MIIDFHTHIFPDRIAEKTISLLASRGGREPSFNGTEAGLLSKMRDAGVDISICLPVVTSPKQFDSILEFADGVNRRYGHPSERRIISFAGIHPGCDDIGGKMKLISERGFLGVKIHPDYQDTFINDERYVEILKYAREYDLIVVTHAGVDGAYRDREVRCTPERVIDLIRRVPHEKFILAHYGGNEMTEQVASLLCGENIYFDTGLVLDYIDDNSFKKILDKHGADKILFATDGPWADAEAYIARIRSLGLGEDAENKIFSENAKRLINLR
ncbi:MAG: amidohydrolase family protein [Clostridia bacterium]|nr:amidohydrolase family protein [Clostridia bacterium]